MLKAIFFDIDNTLLSFDSYVKDFMKTGFEKYNLPAYDDSMFDVFTRVNGGLWKAYESGDVSFAALKQNRWNLVFEELGIDFDGVLFEKLFREGLLNSAIHEDGAIELLQYLYEKYTLCAASNGPYYQQYNRLVVGGMMSYLTHVFVSEDLGFSKPSKEFYNACFEQLGFDIKPSEIMMIGDSLSSDILGGINSGLKTCYYNPKGTALPDDIKPDYVVTSLKEIETIL